MPTTPGPTRRKKHKFAPRGRLSLDNWGPHTGSAKLLMHDSRPDPYPSCGPLRRATAACWGHAAGERCQKGFVLPIYLSRTSVNEQSSYLGVWYGSGSGVPRRSPESLAELPLEEPEPASHQRPGGRSARLPHELLDLRFVLQCLGVERRIIEVLTKDVRQLLLRARVLGPSRAPVLRDEEQLRSARERL